ncbi:hypothetical protein [Rhizobium nepotum]|uniref:hypothetical protein n=1 Tax=Rhizobium nepotum TaxID=1035271 RepID=UPI001F256D00|nr:hypothetical protein [Rhizobium nepotum]
MGDDGGGLLCRQKAKKRQAKHQNMLRLTSTGPRLIDGRIQLGIDIDGREGWRVAGKPQPFELCGKGRDFPGFQQYSVRDRWRRYRRIGAQDHQPIKKP